MWSRDKRASGGEWCDVPYAQDLWTRFFDLQDRMEKAQGTTVKEAMHEVDTISPDMLLADAANVMLDGRLNRLCVVDEEKRLVGGDLH